KHLDLARDHVQLASRGYVVEILGAREAQMDQDITRRTGIRPLIGVGKADRAGLDAAILQGNGRPRLEQRFRRLAARIAPHRDQQMLHDDGDYDGNDRVRTRAPNRARCTTVASRCHGGAIRSPSRIERPGTTTSCWTPTSAASCSKGPRSSRFETG